MAQQSHLLVLLDMPGMDGYRLGRDGRHRNGARRVVSLEQRSGFEAVPDAVDGQVIVQSVITLGLRYR